MPLTASAAQGTQAQSVMLQFECLPLSGACSASACTEGRSSRWAMHAVELGWAGCRLCAEGIDNSHAVSIMLCNAATRAARQAPNLKPCQGASREPGTLPAATPLPAPRSSSPRTPLPVSELLLARSGARSCTLPHRAAPQVGRRPRVLQLVARAHPSVAAGSKQPRQPSCLQSNAPLSAAARGVRQLSWTHPAATLGPPRRRQQQQQQRQGRQQQQEDAVAAGRNCAGRAQPRPRGRLLRAGVAMHRSLQRSSDAARWPRYPLPARRSAARWQRSQAGRRSSAPRLAAAAASAPGE
jgi:hypothetical protein